MARLGRACDHPPMTGWGQLSDISGATTACRTTSSAGPRLADVGERTAVGPPVDRLTAHGVKQAGRSDVGSAEGWIGWLGRWTVEPDHLRDLVLQIETTSFMRGSGASV